MVEPIIRDVEEILKPVYLVGGSVRDILLGLEPKDYDFTTPLAPDEIEEKVRASGRRPHITGKRFGTIGFKLGPHFVEITTFRTETYGKTRKPHVDFVDTINEDLSRRDFTINAIALRGQRYIDPFGGRADLTQKLIRCVGNPALRFNEDPLRMLRAARFAAQLNFTIEDKTLHAIAHHAPKIMNVSRERWVQELDKLLTSRHPGAGLSVLAATDLIRYILPEMRLQVGYDQHSPYHELDLWSHSIATVERVPAEPVLRWAALLHDIGKPFARTNKPDRSNYVDHDVIGADIVYGIGKRLKWSNERIQQVETLVLEHLQTDSPLHTADAASTKHG